jgi:hypothetical protein
VAIGDVLKSPLKSGTVATFGPITCTTSTISMTVTANPPAGGNATASLDPLVFTGCTISAMGITCVQDLSVDQSSTITINGGSKIVTTGALHVTLRICTALGTVTCVYQSSTGSGKWSNTDNSLHLDAMLTKSGGPNLCPGSLTASATWAPIRDTSSSSAASVVFVQ